MLLTTIGLVLLLVGWIWLMVVAYKATGALWAVLIFFFQVLAGLIFCIMHRIGWMQWGLMVLGCLLIILGGGMAAMQAM